MRFYLVRVLLMLAVVASCSSCILWRLAGHGTEGIDDFKTFPTDTVRPAAEPFRFVKAEQSVLDTMRLGHYLTTPITLRQMIDTLSGRNPSAGVVVVRNDTILFEHYRGEVGADKHSTIFSISKSVTSLLVGMAIDRGLIRSVADPVTKYLPELRHEAPEFARLTIENLLDMRTGLAFKENYAPNPFSAMARLHYGRHIMRQIRNQRFKEEPDTRFAYNSMSTAVLGAVLERATGRRYADLLTEWVWQPLGMERYALVNLDDNEHRMAKAYGGISTNPRDLARWGRLYLRRGVWEDERLVSEAWIDRSLSAKRAAANDGYSNSFRSVMVTYHDEGRKHFTADELPDVMLRAHERYGYAFDEMVPTRNDDGTWRLRIVSRRYYALGVFGQVVFLDPEKQIVAVYLGEDRCDEMASVFYRMAEKL